VLLTKLTWPSRRERAEASVTLAQAELGVALEGGRPAAPRAKKLHPKVKDFEAYLKRVDGLGTVAGL